MGLDAKVKKIESACWLIEDEDAHLEDDFDEVQTVVENCDNLAKKPNIKLWGSKERVEGRDLLQYLQD